MEQTTTDNIVQIHTCQHGLPVFLDKDTEEIIYKEHRFSFWKAKEAIESGWAEVELSDKLTFVKGHNWVEFSCLKIEESKVKHLIKIVCKLLTK